MKASESTSKFVDTIEDSKVRSFIGNSQHWCRWDLRSKNLKLPKRYATAKLEDFPEWYADLLSQPLFICGKAGSGKTHLTAALARRQVAIGLHEGIESGRYYARFVSVPDLMAEVKATFSQHSEETEQDVFDSYANACWLYLDDFGTEKLTDWAYEFLYRLINYRWCELLPTIISSNFEIQQIAEMHGDRIASRIIGMGKVINLRGENKFFEVSHK